MQDDRRQHPRHLLVLPLRIIGADEAAPATGSSRDISEGGLRVVASNALGLGERVAIELDAGGGAVLTAQATVMWSAENDGGEHVAGLRFDAHAGDTRERLRALLRTSAEEKALSTDEGRDE